MLSLSVVVPAFNEENRLPGTMLRLAAFLDETPHSFAEVIIVNDGSSDATVKVAAQMMKVDSRFRLVSNAGNRGKGYAVRNGMLEAKGEWRLMTDADLSTPISEFAKLHTAAESQKAAIAIGSRALNRALVSRHQSLLREAGGRFFNVLMRVLTGLPFSDTQCGFKLYRADAAESVFSRQVLDGFCFDVEDLFIAQKLGLSCVEVPVVWANVDGTKVTTAATIRALSDLWKIRQYSWRGHYAQQLSEAAIRTHR